MPRRYAEIYPSLPLLNSAEMQHVSAAALMSLRYFQAEPDTMPEEVFAEHLILLNFCDMPHRVQNRRDGEMLDCTIRKHDIIVTPRWKALGLALVWPLGRDRHDARSRAG